MKRKGFTLIELLAVIVVLAIIAVIAVPTILNVVEKARKGASVSSAYGYIDAVEKYIVMHNIDSTKYPYELNNNTWNVSKTNNDTPALNTIINVKGKKPESGTVTINEKGNVSSAKIVINSYVIECLNKTCSVKGKQISAKSLNIVDKSVTDVYIGSTLKLNVNVEPKNALVEWTSSDESVATVKDGLVTGIKVGTVTITAISGSTTDSIILNVGYKVYKNGTAVYYNPETNTKCSESEAMSNYEVNGIKNTKTGCMKWYTFNDSALSTTVNMILDHNSTLFIKTSGNTATALANYINSKYAEDTATWNASLNARAITADEVAQITKNTSFNQNTSGETDWFYLDSNNQTQTAKSKGASNYAWLYDYTYNCENYGCNTLYGTQYDSTAGYWTTTPVYGSNSKVWIVQKEGSLNSAYNKNDFSYDSSYKGLRPVITVSKESLE